MYSPSENMANAFFVTVTGFPATVFAIALSQGDIALIAIAVNIILAVLMKGVDVYIRIHFKDKK